MSERIPSCEGCGVPVYLASKELAASNQLGKPENGQPQPVRHPVEKVYNRCLIEDIDTVHSETKSSGTSTQGPVKATALIG